MQKTPPKQSLRGETQALGLAEKQQIPRSFSPRWGRGCGRLGMTILETGLGTQEWSNPGFGLGRATADSSLVLAALGARLRTARNDNFKTSATKPVQAKPERATLKREDNGCSRSFL
jgi:hypothetical protein